MRNHNLAIGSASNFLRIPMNLHTAVTVAERFGFVLPTRKMMDAIYLQSRYRWSTDEVNGILFDP